MVAYGVQTYETLEARTGHATGWRQTGRVMFATTRERMVEYDLLPAIGRQRGMTIETLSPKEVVERLPIANDYGIVGGIWIPGDGRVSPTDLTAAYARGAKKEGAVICENTPALRILVKGGRISGVLTANGPIDCERVVIAAGLWSPVIAATAGISIPLHSVEHQYILTGSDSTITREMPMFLSYDERCYGREESGGLLIGFFDRLATPVSPCDLPVDFSFGLLEPNLEQIEPDMATAIRRFPMLGAVPIRKIINGPESFTPDMEMLLGEVPEVANCFVATGMNSSGVALSAAVGRVTAEIVLDGRPSLDVDFLDIKRFGPLAGRESYVRRRASAAVAGLYNTSDAIDDNQPGRMIRCSPVHHRLKIKGARFEAVNEWEVPAWYGEDRESAVASELTALRDGIAIIDCSSDIVLELGGAGVASLLPALCGTIPAVGCLRRLVIHGREGGVDATATALRVDENKLLICSDAAQESRILALGRMWREEYDLESCAPVPSIAGFQLRGPLVSTMLDALACNSTRLEPEINHVPVSIAHEAIEKTATIRFKAESAAGILRAIEEAGEPIGLVFVGSRALEHDRISRALPAFGYEFSATSPQIATTKARTRSPKSSERVGHLATAILSSTHGVPLLHRPVFDGGEIVGRVTSVSSVGDETAILAVVDANARPGLHVDASFGKFTLEVVH
jgi:4-methylaminobutanoate oxidase (formaldehyde-forming)